MGGNPRGVIRRAHLHPSAIPFPHLHLRRLFHYTLYADCPADRLGKEDLEETRIHTYTHLSQNNQRGIPRDCLHPYTVRFELKAQFHLIGFESELCPRSGGQFNVFFSHSEFSNNAKIMKSASWGVQKFISYMNRYFICKAHMSCFSNQKYQVLLAPGTSLASLGLVYTYDLHHSGFLDFRYQR